MKDEEERSSTDEREREARQTSERAQHRGGAKCETSAADGDLEEGMNSA
jgi:hypothetical protein